ncbi:MAG: alcohol dehydrogenase catalytic domain-containing protein [Kiritimatiellia bacterium]
MKTMALTGLRRLSMLDAPEPVLTREADVLLRLTAIGVCGSDIHYYTTGKIGSQVVRFPFRVGHECAGVVEKIGRAVTGLKPGDRVAVDPAMWCGVCDQCRAGRFNTCRRLLFLGCPGQAEGCLCERLVMPAASCFKVPDGMSDELAALIEPLTIGVYAVARATPLAGAAIGILGSGPIGLSVLLAARAAGARAVYVTDKIDARLRAAAGAGAGWTGNPDRGDVVAAVAKAEPPLLDCVFECCGQQEALDQAVRLLKPGGTLMMVGIPAVDRVSFEIELLRRREIRLQNVRRQNEKVPETIRLVESGALKPGFMVTHRFPFSETPAAFDLVDSYSDGVVKAMIHFNE